MLTFEATTADKWTCIVGLLLLSVAQALAVVCALRQHHKDCERSHSCKNKKPS